MKIKKHLYSQNVTSSRQIYLYTFLKQGFVCFHHPKNILNIKFQCGNKEKQNRYSDL